MFCRKRLLPVVLTASFPPGRITFVPIMSKETPSRCFDSIFPAWKNYLCAHIGMGNTNDEKWDYRSNSHRFAYFTFRRDGDSVFNSVNSRVKSRIIPLKWKSVEKVTGNFFLFIGFSCAEFLNLIAKNA
jgi:hypothetical protein